MAARFSFQFTRDAAVVRYVFGRAFPTLEAERGRGIFDHFARTNDCIAACCDGELVGLFMLCRLNDVLGEVHFALLPAVWGRLSVALARGALEWIWAHTDYERLQGAIDVENRLAVRFAARVGFPVWGLNESAMRKHGKLTDAVMIGATRGK